MAGSRAVKSVTVAVYRSSSDVISDVLFCSGLNGHRATPVTRLPSTSDNWLGCVHNNGFTGHSATTRKLKAAYRLITSNSIVTSVARIFLREFKLFSSNYGIAITFARWRF